MLNEQNIPVFTTVHGINYKNDNSELIIEIF